MVAPPEIWQANTAALRRVAPALLQRLAWSKLEDHVQILPSGEVLLLGHTAKYPVTLGPQACAEWIRTVPQGAERVQLVGLGLGEPIAALLEQNPRRHIRAWERDPFLLQLALEHSDLSGPLASGQLELQLGVDGCLALDDWGQSLLVQHPVLGPIYREEVSACQRAAAGRAPTRWVGLATGGLFVGDLAEGLEQRGFGVCPLELRRWSLQEIERSLALLAPELVLAVNYIAGLCELCQRADTRLAIWEIDPTTDRHPTVQGPTQHCVVHTFREENVQAFEGAGFAHVEHRLLAANPARRRPLAAEQGEPAYPLAFVGSSMHAQARTYQAQFLDTYAAWHPEGRAVLPRVQETLRAIFAAQRKDPFHWCLPQLAQSAFGEFLADCDRAGTECDPLLLLAETCAAEKRLSLVANLGHLGMHVWGDDGWRACEAHGAVYHGPAGHGQELTEIYNSAAIHVDIGRIYQGEIATMRCFDVLACGGFLLAEHNLDLERGFRIGEEIETYRSLKELKAKAAHYLAHPGQAARVAAAGRQAVLERHTIGQRLDTILARSCVAA